MLVLWGHASLLLVAAVFSCMLAHGSARIKKQQEGSGEVVTNEDPVWSLRHALPELDLENNTVTDVKVNVGDVAYLPCRFPKLSTLHEVSWIRRWDWNILTTGIYTYTSDMRVNVLHTEGSDDWTLQLKYVDTRDSGTYECQMYTGTGVLSQYVNLHVTKPRATIHGPAELHVQAGDIIKLVCVIQQSKPPFVFWYHGDKMVSYGGQKHRINVLTQVKDAKTHSRLTIKDARLKDSGNYSCIPPNVDSAFVMVYVTDGDNVAAVHRRGLSSASPTKPSFVTLSLISINLSLTFVITCIFSTR